MHRGLALAVLLTGCTAVGSPPDHPLVGEWRGERPLTLKTTEYSFGGETGYWTAGSSDFRFKRGAAAALGGVQERCDYSLTGRVLVMSGCRLAGRYTRTP